MLMNQKYPILAFTISTCPRRPNWMHREFRSSKCLYCHSNSKSIAHDAPFTPSIPRTPFMPINQISKMIPGSRPIPSFPQEVPSDITTQDLFSNQSDPLFPQSLFPVQSQAAHIAIPTAAAIYHHAPSCSPCLPLAILPAEVLV
jgi:hypothetical protein